MERDPDLTVERDGVEDACKWQNRAVGVVRGSQVEAVLGVIKQRVGAAGGSGGGSGGGAGAAAAAAAAAAASAVLGAAVSASGGAADALLRAELAEERAAREAAMAELEVLRSSEVGSLREQLEMLKELYEDEQGFGAKVGGQTG